MVCAIVWGHAVAYWLRRWATRRKVTDLRPDEVLESVTFRLVAQRKFT
jgi:hypothetical protein